MARKTTLKENRFRLGVLLGGLVLGSIISWFILPAMTGRELPWWITLVSALATIIIFVPIVFLGMKLGDRLLVKDRIEVGMRASGTKK